MRAVVRIPWLVAIPAYALAGALVLACVLLAVVAIVVIAVVNLAVIVVGTILIRGKRNNG